MHIASFPAVSGLGTRLVCTSLGSKAAKDRDNHAWVTPTLLSSSELSFASAELVERHRFTGCRTTKLNVHKQSYIMFQCGRVHDYSTPGG